MPISWKEMIKKRLCLLVLAGLFSGCSQNQTAAMPQSIVHISGTVVDNPAHLTDQTAFMLIDSNENKLLGYIESKTIALGDFLERSGTIDGKLIRTDAEAVPTIEVTSFTPSQPLTEEDILLSALRRESKKQPYNYRWDQTTSMLVLQRDSSNGSAQVQVQDDQGKYLISLVKNSNDWHIADIKQVEYSPNENTTSTGSISPQATP